MKTSFSWKQQQQFANHPINPDFSACCGVVNLLLMEKHDFSLPFKIPSFYEMKDDVAAFLHTTLQTLMLSKRNSILTLRVHFSKRILVYTHCFITFFTRDSIALGVFR